MNLTRRGKIARLPRDIRDQLGNRLEDGESAATILAWLNALPEVQTVLQEQFKGLPINEPNLCEWKKRGHQDWLRLQHSRELAERLAEQSEIFQKDAGGQSISDRFATVLALEFSRLADDLLAEETDPEKRFEKLCRIHREFSRLRRDDHQATRTRIKDEQEARQKADHQHEEQKIAAERRREGLLAPMNAQLQFNPLVEKMGGGHWSHAAAAYILEAENHLPLGHFGYKNPLNVRYKPQYDPSELKLTPAEHRAVASPMAVTQLPQSLKEN